MCVSMHRLACMHACIHVQGLHAAHLALAALAHPWARTACGTWCRRCWAYLGAAQRPRALGARAPARWCPAGRQRACRCLGWWCSAAWSHMHACGGMQGIFRAGAATTEFHDTP